MNNDADSLEMLNITITHFQLVSDVSSFGIPDQPLNEPILGCTNATNVLKSNISTFPAATLSSGNHFLPSLVSKKPVFLCLFLLDDKGFAV